MAEFDREFLLGHGVPEERVEEVLAAHEAAVSAALADMISREEAQRLSDEAVAEAMKGAVSREEAKRLSDEAVAEAMKGAVSREEAQRQADEALKGADPEAVARLEEECDRLRAIGGEDFAEVKPKFREQVYALLERGDGARPIVEQLAALREEYEEYFISGEKTRRLPRFGGPTRGSMPRGAIGAAEQFRQTWGFGPGR